MIALIPLNVWEATALVMLALLVAFTLVFFLGSALGWLVRWWALCGRYKVEEVIAACAEAIEMLDSEAPSPAVQDKKVVGDPIFRAPPLVNAPVRFVGWQDTLGTGLAPFEIYNLLEEIPGYPQGSTVSRRTLEQLGYIVPPAPYQLREPAESAGLLAASADGVAGIPLHFSQRKP